MLIEKIPGIQQLTKNEKVVLASELWESTRAFEFDWPVSPELIKELDRRWEDYQKDPSRASTWNEVKERLSKKLKND